LSHWIDDLNRSDPDDINGAIPNAEVWQWLQANAPLFVSSKLAFRHFHHVGRAPMELRKRTYYGRGDHYNHSSYA
jgi:hypothetical protein